MKPVRFIGSAKDELSAFPKSARTRAGEVPEDVAFRLELGEAALPRRA